MKVKIKIRKQKKISKNHKAGVNSIRSIQFKEEQLRQRRFSLFLVSVYIQSTIRTIGLVTIYVNILYERLQYQTTGSKNLRKFRIG